MARPLSTAHGYYGVPADTGQLSGAAGYVAPPDPADVLSGAPGFFTVGVGILSDSSGFFQIEKVLTIYVESGYVVLDYVE